jgi:hypothetical protein
MAIVVNGKGVLHRKIGVENTSKNLIDNILPNANPHEFFQSVTEWNAFTSISIIRKELLEKIVLEFQKKGCTLLSVSIGVADIQYLAPFLTFEAQPVLYTTHFLVHFNDQNQPVEIENSVSPVGHAQGRTEYNIGDQYIKSPILLAFGAAMGLLASDPEVPPSFPNGELVKAREEYNYSRFYSVALWTLLATLFGILLINFFIYNHYFSKNKELQDSRLISSGQEEKIKKLEAAILVKENFLSRSGWNTQSRLSYFADRIAGLVPAGALLTNMKIFPVNTGYISEEAPLTFKKDTIQLSGSCDDPTELNQFANNLRNIQDFKTVSIKNYAYKKEVQGSVFLMEIITR